MADVNIINARIYGQGTYLLLYLNAAGVFKIVNSVMPIGISRVPVFLRINGPGNELTFTSTDEGFSATTNPIKDGSECVPFYGAVVGTAPFIYIEYPPGTVSAGGITDTLSNILGGSNIIAGMVDFSYAGNPMLVVLEDF